MARRLIATLCFAIAAPALYAQTPPPTPPPTQQPQEQQAPPEQTLPALAPLDSRSYQVGPGDKLSITIFGEPSLPQQFTIAADGMITFPFVNRVRVAEMTVRELEEDLHRRLVEGKYYENPTITAEVLEYRSQRVQIMGAVGTPGELQLAGTEMTLSRALAKAGLGALAGSYVEIRRPKASAPDGQVEYDTQIVQMKDLLELVDDPRLRDGDHIFVPQAPVYVVTGFVRQPGNFVWKPGITVLQAIGIAGGITERGTYRGLKVVRLINGEYKELRAELETVLLPDDQLRVAQRIF